MDEYQALRSLLAHQLDWGEAHVGFARALADFPDELLGVVPDGAVHSAWQLLEHMRRAQADILDFCVNPDYVYPASMEEYWPGVTPAAGESWGATVAAFLDDIAALKRLALDESRELLEAVPTARSESQTLARELILATDHNAYHLGQLVALRRTLDAWQDGPGWG
ncbi:MAG: DinB family protein [Coriobacteriia bacterium]